MKAKTLELANGDVYENVDIYIPDEAKGNFIEVTMDGHDYYVNVGYVVMFKPNKPKTLKFPLGGLKC